MLPHFLDNRLTDGGEIVSLTRRTRFNSFVRGWVNLRAAVRLEGLGKMKKLNDVIENRRRDLPGCNIVSQPTMPPRPSM
jgi:hypothetical protein